jgi:isopenicillin N synthase-like dioxygenase
VNVRTVRYDSPNAPGELARSLLETGFAVLTEHPIPGSLIANAYAEWAAFFASPAKADHTFIPAEQTGYFPFRSEKAKDSPLMDLKEFYHHNPARRELPSEVRRFTPDLYRRLAELGSELLKWIEEETPPAVTGLFPSHLTEMIAGSDATLLRILHYPPLTGTEEEGAERAAAHADINLMTLLPAATAAGLELMDTQGRWHRVESDAGMIVINSGDMLRETSGGYYPSTTHRVVKPVGAEARSSRYSMPFFLHPRNDALLTPLRTAGAFLAERLRENGVLD